MIKTELTFLFFFIFLICNSQISGVIYNELNLPVENVSVFLLKNKDTVHTVLSDKKGFFEFNDNFESENVELLLSHISYEILMTQPTNERTYFLVPKQYLIESVSVTSPKKKKRKIQ